MTQGLILAKFHFYSLWNWRSVYIGRFIEPVAYLALLGGGLSASVQTSGSYTDFILSGLICLVAFRAATSTVSDVANDRKWGVFAIFTMQGGSIGGYLVSLCIFAVCVFLAQVAVLISVALVLFGESDYSLLDFGAFALIGSLIVAGWVGFGASAGAKIQSYSKRDLIVTLTTLPVVLAAPLFYPVDSSPNYLRFISSVNPLTYQVGWIRGTDSSFFMSLGMAGVWAAVGLGLAFILLSSADKISSER